MGEGLPLPDEQILRLHLESGRFRSGAAVRAVAPGVTQLASPGDRDHGA